MLLAKNIYDSDSELLCSQYVLSIFVTISSLDASVRNFDISSPFWCQTRSFHSLAWCLMFLKIRVFLKDLFFNSFIPLLSSSNMLSLLVFWSLIWNFKPSISSVFLLVLILDYSGAIALSYPPLRVRGRVTIYLFPCLSNFQ